MIFPSRFKNPADQSGTTLVEAIVTMLLVAIIGMGSVRLLGSSALAQRDMNAMGTAFGQMREVVQSGHCGTAGATLKVGDKSIAATCSTPSVAITVSSKKLIDEGGSSINTNVNIPNITATSDELFGGELVVNSTN